MGNAAMAEEMIDLSHEFFEFIFKSSLQMSPLTVGFPLGVTVDGRERHVRVAFGLEAEGDAGLVADRYFR